MAMKDVFRLSRDGGGWTFSLDFENLRMAVRAALGGFLRLFLECVIWSFAVLIAIVSLAWIL